MLHPPRTCVHAPCPLFWYHPVLCLVLTVNGCDYDDDDDDDDDEDDDD